MPSTDLIALIALPIALGVATALTCVSPRARDAAFVLMVGGLVVATNLDVNFLSHEWYRGTTRGVEVSLIDVLALSLLISSVRSARAGGARLYWPASLGLMLMFLLYCCVSVALSHPRIYGVFELTKLFRALIYFLAAAWFVQSEREVRLLVFALACAVLFEGGLAFKQRYLDGIFRVGGTLEHANSLSMYLLITGPVLVAALLSRLPRRLRRLSVAAVGLSMVTILLTASRMGVPAFALVMLGTVLVSTSWRLTRRKVLVSLGILLAAGGLLFKAWDTLKARYEEATLAEEEEEGRGQYIQLARIVLAERFWGVGLNNWSYWVSKRYSAALGLEYEDYEDIPESMITSPEVFDWSYKYAPPAHNLGALIAGELGVPGLVLFGLLWLRWFGLGAGFLRARTREPLSRLGVGIFFALGGAFLQSLTEWAYRQTSILLTLHVLLGVLASLYYLKRRAASLPQTDAVKLPGTSPHLLPGGAHPER